MSIDVKRGLHALVTTKVSEDNYLGLIPGTPPRGYKAEPYQLGIKRNGQPRIVQRWLPDMELWERCQLAWKMRAEGASLKEVHIATGLYRNISTYSNFFSNDIYRGTLNFGDLHINDYLPAVCTEDQWRAVALLRKRKFSTRKWHQFAEGTWPADELPTYRGTRVRILRQSYGRQPPEA